MAMIVIAKGTDEYAELIKFWNANLLLDDIAGRLRRSRLTLTLTLTHNLDDFPPRDLRNKGSNRPKRPTLPALPSVVAVAAVVPARIAEPTPESAMVARPNWLCQYPSGAGKTLGFRCERRALRGGDRHPRHGAFPMIRDSAYCADHHVICFQE